MKIDIQKAFDSDWKGLQISKNIGGNGVLLNFSGLD